MPPFAPAENNAYQQPDAFQDLDAFLNGDRELAASFHEGLRHVVAHPDQPNYGPFADNPSMQDHWRQDWTNGAGHGGTLWPYLMDVNIREELRAALTTSVGIAVEQGKTHHTIWLPYAEVPAEVGGGGSLSENEQHQLFTAVVHETADAVHLVILTPQPIAF